MGMEITSTKKVVETVVVVDTGAAPSGMWTQLKVQTENGEVVYTQLSVHGQGNVEVPLDFLRRAVQEVDAKLAGGGATPST